MAVVLSIMGKIGPKRVIKFISASLVVFLGNFCWNNGIDGVLEKMPSFAQEKKQQEEMEPVPLFGSDGMENDKTKEPPDFGSIQYDDSRDYEVRDEKFWTYRSEGFWKWDENFKVAFKHKTGWSYAKKGNYRFSVDYVGSISKDEANDEQLYVFSGGPVEITVNGEKCCCQEKLRLKKGLSGRNMAELKVNLQNGITSLINDQRDFVIYSIKACLKP